MVLLLTERQVRSLSSPALALASVRSAFLELATGRVQQPPSLNLAIPEMDAEVHVKTAYGAALPAFAVKVSSAFYRNRESGLPVVGGVQLVLDADSGATAGVLLDNGYLTELRTGAAGALAAELLAAREPHTVAILGSGGQAGYQLAALLQVRRPKQVLVWSRDRSRAEAFAREAGQIHGLPVVAVRDPEQAVRAAQIVVTTTPARQPLVHADWVQPGTHLTAMGSDFPDKQELDVQVLAHADRVVADTVANCMANGETRHAVAAGVLAAHDVEELADVVAGRRPGRQSADEVTVADQCGLGIEDTAIAAAVLAEARKRHVGMEIDTGREN